MFLFHDRFSLECLKWVNHIGNKCNERTTMLKKCNGGMSQGQNSLVSKGKPPKFTNAKYLLVHTLIASFCEVAFKIR